MTKKSAKVIVVVLAIMVFLLIIACDDADVPTTSGNKYWLQLVCNGKTTVAKVVVSHSLSSDGETVTVKYVKANGKEEEFTYAGDSGCSVVTSDI